MSVMVFVYLLASLYYTYVGISTYTYDPSNKANRIFLVICIDLSLWALMLVMINAVSDAQTATVFRQVATFFWSTVYCLLLHLFLIWINKAEFLKKIGFLFLFYSPALISIYLYYFYRPAAAADIVKIPYTWAYLNPMGQGFLWDYFLNVYYLTYSVIGIVLLYIWGRKSPFRREKYQSRIIIATYVSVLAIGSVTDIILPNLEIPLLPPLSILFIIIPISGIWYSIKKYRLMNLNPENVVLDVMKTMSEGLVIIDNNRMIREINTGAEELLGYTKAELENKSAGQIFFHRSALQDIDTGQPKESMLKTKDGKGLPVLLSVSVMADEWSEPYGFVLIFRDLSEIKKMQHHLQESHDELEIRVHERTKELNAANNGLRDEILVRIKMEKEIEKLAYYDHLTSLPNRKLFHDSLTKKIYESIRKEHPFSIFFLDLDFFKMINDTLGHEQGDVLLKQVAFRMAKKLTSADTIGRIGGDEFLILIDGAPDRVTSELAAAQLIDSFRKPFNLSGNEIYVTASVGIAIYPLDGEDADTLIQNADIAMYKAKANGRNKFESCTPTMRNNLLETMNLTNHLYMALDRNELELYYQPQVDSDSGRIIGLEALIRWNHPEIGIIPPDDFIPIAEKTGLIIPIGEWALRKACRQNREWQDQGMFAVPIAVNISIKQFMDANLVAKVADILWETGLSPRFLEIEITESLLMKEVCIINETLSQFKKLGVHITIDDFGIEYSSLNYLKQLPISRIKVAGTFIQGIDVNKKDEAIIQAIVSLARNLGIKTIAEGVETASQMEFIKKVKCDAIQGFYFYKPVAAEAIESLFANCY